MDLFEQYLTKITEKEASIAALMCPRTLDEFVGQDHIKGCSSYEARLAKNSVQFVNNN